MSTAMSTARMVWGWVTWLAQWCGRHPIWVAAWTVVAALASWAEVYGWAVMLGLAAWLPCVVACMWAHRSPVTYERWAAGPWRRLGWRRMIRRQWSDVARESNLSAHKMVKVTGRDGVKRSESRWVPPRLLRVRVRGYAVRLTIRARKGQTLGELEAGAERLASTWDAHAFRTWPDPKNPGSTVVVELVMHDLLTTPADAVEPEPRALCEYVDLGRTQGGGRWLLPIMGRHTLGVGCSGSGKGSILWGIACGLAPAVRADLVRLWGVDLKRGVEIAMGAGLYSARAYTPADALKVLRALKDVIDERGAQMVGVTRLHKPTIGDPLHVLIIDELAALTAYADYETRRDAERLLSEILTQGRALGVVVVAFVQDPRKEVVNMRGLFTQTIALRLRNGDETTMTLGDGMTHIAPAHRINPGHPGTAWIVEDTGAVDRVRADFWADPLIRDLATRYATDVHIDLPEDEDDDGATDAMTMTKPRGPRKPRTPRSPRSKGGNTGEESAA